MRDCETVLRIRLHWLPINFMRLFWDGHCVLGKAGAADIMYGLRRGMIDHRLSKIIRNTIPLRLAKQSVICIRIPALWKTLMFKKGCGAAAAFSVRRTVFE